MKKKLFVLIFLTVTTLFFANKIKVLIDTFVNVNKDPQYEFIKGNIGDALNAKLSQQGKFEVSLLSEVEPTISNTDKAQVMRYAFNNKYDIVIFGFFYTSDDNIRVHFSVEDVITGRNKITYFENGGVGIEIYSLIDNSTKILTQKMAKEIEPYPEEFINKQRKERKSQMFGSKVDFLFLLESDGVVNITPIISYDHHFPTSSILTGSTNILTHFFWETPNKKDYLGFGIFFTIPILVNIGYLDLHYSVFLSYAYAKKFFFDFTFDVFVFQQDSIETNYNYVNFSINNIYFTSYFYFTYFFNDKVSITTGISFPLNTGFNKRFYADDSNEKITNGFNTITFLLDNDKSPTAPQVNGNYTLIVSQKSFVSPSLQLGFTVYPNKKLGFNFKTDISFVYIDTTDFYNNANETIGQGLEVTVKLSLGISFKDKQTLTFSQK